MFAIHVSLGKSGGLGQRERLRLIIGAAALGNVQSLLAKQTDSIFWPIVAHTMGGLIMVL